MYLLFGKALVLARARAAVAHDPVATDWVDTVLSNFLDRERAIATLPPNLAWKADLTHCQGAVPSEYLPGLAPLLALAVSGRALAPDRVRKVSVEQAVAFADQAARREIEACRLSTRELAAARDAVPSFDWHSTGEPNHASVEAKVALGRVGVRVCFTRRGPETWELGWGLDKASETALRGLSFRGIDGRRRAGSGMFPAIDAAVRQAAREFMDRYRPSSVLVRGSDAKRNAHYVSTYGTISSEEYDASPIPGGGIRASADGHGGVELVRRPGLEAGPVRPFPKRARPFDEAYPAPEPDVPETADFAPMMAR